MTPSGHSVPTHDVGTIRISFAFQIAVFWIALAIGAAVALLFILGDATWQPAIIFCASTAGVVFAGYGAYYAGASVKKQIDFKMAEMARDEQAVEEKRRAERIANAFRIIARTNRVYFVSLRMVVNDGLQEIEKNRKKNASMYEEIRADRRLRLAVGTLLGTFEDIAVAIRLGYADESILYYSQFHVVDTLYERLKGYIDEVRRKSLPGQAAMAPGVYKELETLAHKWKAHQSLFTGESVEWHLTVGQPNSSSSNAIST